eukprot:Skav231064  [mRNA]  locus=scaffold768:148203:149223:- [translate_table: standard]
MSNQDPLIFILTGRESPCPWIWQTILPVVSEASSALEVTLCGKKLSPPREIPMSANLVTGSFSISKVTVSPFDALISEPLPCTNSEVPSALSTVIFVIPSLVSVKETLTA